MDIQHREQKERNSQSYSINSFGEDIGTDKATLMQIWLSSPFTSVLCLPQHHGSCGGEAELTWAREQQVLPGVEQAEAADIQPRAQQQLQHAMGLQGTSEESLKQQHHGNLDSQRKTWKNEGNASKSSTTSELQPCCSPGVPRVDLHCQSYREAWVWFLFLCSSHRRLLALD